MLIYDVNKGEFTKLAADWDWESMAQYLKGPLYGGIGGLAVGALLDLLFPGYKSKMLPLGLLGLVGGGAYNLLGGVKPPEKAIDAIVAHYKALNKFVNTANNKPLAIPGYKLEDIGTINPKDTAGLYNRLISSTLSGDTSLLRTLYSVDKTGATLGGNVDLSQFIDDVENDISFAFIVSSLGGAEKTVHDLLARYLHTKQNYYDALVTQAKQAPAQAEQPGSQIDPDIYKKDAERIKSVIVAMLRNNPKNEKYLTDVPKVGLQYLNWELASTISALGK